MATSDGSADTPREPRQDYAPEGSAHGTSRFQTLKRTFTEFSEDNMSDSAAALTYYGLLAVFPALIALVAIVGLTGKWRWGRDRLSGMGRSDWSSVQAAIASLSVTVWPRRWS